MPRFIVPLCEKQTAALLHLPSHSAMLGCAAQNCCGYIDHLRALFLSLPLPLPYCPVRFFNFANPPSLSSALCDCPSLFCLAECFSSFLPFSPPPTCASASHLHSDAFIVLYRTLDSSFGCHQESAVVVLPIKHSFSRYSRNLSRFCCHNCEIVKVPAAWIQSGHVKVVIMVQRRWTMGHAELARMRNTQIIREQRDKYNAK